MTRLVNTLELCWYNGPKPSWKGGRRWCVLYWRDKKVGRLLDLGALTIYRVPVETLADPYLQLAGTAKLKPIIRHLGIYARTRSKQGVDLPLETIGAILKAAKGYTP